MEKEFSEFTKVRSLPISIPYEVWGRAITQNNESLQVYINKSDIYVYGTLSKYPQTAYISTDVVLPV